MFIIYLLIGIIIWFIIKIYVSLHNARRRARDLFGQFGAQEAPRSSGRKAGWSGAPQTKRKKIDSSVGEYVAFEEITEVSSHTTASSSDDRTAGDIEVEQQVTDVEWEDIK